MRSRRFGKIRRDSRSVGGESPMVYRLAKGVRRPLMVAVLLFVAAPRLAVGPQTPGVDTLQEAKRLALLNNWTEAARVFDGIERYGLESREEAAFLLP